MVPRLVLRERTAHCLEGATSQRPLCAAWLPAPPFDLEEITTQTMFRYRQVARTWGYASPFDGCRTASRYTERCANSSELF